MKKVLFIIAISLFSSAVFSAGAWYNGKITRVWKSHSSNFIITLDTAALDDCQYKYAYFREVDLGKEHLSALYSMAMTAFVSNQKVGLVIDKSLEGERCYAKSMDMRK